LFLCYTTTNFKQFCFNLAIRIDSILRGEQMKEKLNLMAVFCDDNGRIARFDEMTNFVFYTKE